MWFHSLRTALKLAGTVVELNDRLTALEGNFDILDRAVKREAARVRAENSRARLKDERPLGPDLPPRATARGSVIPIGGIYKRGGEDGG